MSGIERPWSIAPTVWFVVPDGVDDPEHVSGGDVYDRRIRLELERAGCVVHWTPVPVGDAERAPAEVDPAEDALAAVLARVPSGATVLLDGLVAIGAPDVVAGESGRLDLVVIAHMVASRLLDPAAHDREREALHASRAIVATSGWTRSELLADDLARGEIVVARPGSDPAPQAPGTATGGRLLCVGAIAHHKGQDLLVRALQQMHELQVPGRSAWTCTIVGPDADPGFAAALRRSVVEAGLAGRVRFLGAVPHAEMPGLYAGADVLVVPSRAEAFGMAAAEAVASGLPVLAADVGGLTEAVHGAGTFVPAGDAWALRVAIEQWLGDPGYRSVLRRGADRARRALPGWDETAATILAVVIRASRSDQRTPGARTPSARSMA
jgi:glycosyltransferase involved in cell wall biosynthesis